MATVPQSQEEGSVWAGLSTSTTIPERLKQYDNSTQLSFVTRGATRFMWMISSRFPGKRMVGSREHRVVEIAEHERLVPVTVSSVVGNNHTTFGVPNSYAAYFQPNDVFFVRDLYCAIDLTNLYAGQVTAANALPTNPGPFPRLDYSVGFQPTAVNYSTTFGQDPANPSRFYVDNEQTFVLAVGLPDSASVGNTLITVQRCARGPHARDFGGGQVPQGLVNTGVAANGDAGAIVAGMFLFQGVPSWTEGTGPATGHHKTVEIDNNFTQEFKYALDFTKESSIERSWLNKQQPEISRMLLTLQKAIHMERTFLNSQKGKAKDSAGKVRYTMGGAFEWVPKDTDHILKYPAGSISYSATLDLGTQIFSLGGSETRHLFCGIGVHNAFKKHFYSSGFMRYDERASRDFDIPVDVLEVSGGQIYIHPCWSMSEQGHDMRGLVVDMSKPTFLPVTHEGWDMLVKKHDGLNGQMVEKEEWIGIKGLERRYSDYVQMIDFS